MSAVPLLLQYAHTPTASPLHSTHSTPPPTPPVHQPPLLSRRYIRDESCHALLPRASYRSLRNSYPLDPVEESRLVGLLTRSGAATAIKPYGACTAAPAVSPSPAAVPVAPPSARTSVAPLIPPSGAPHPPPPPPPPSVGSLHVSTSPSGQAPTATFSKGVPALGLTSPSSLKLFHPGKSLKKSQSQLIMPSLLTFLRPHTRGENRTASRGKKETSKGLARDSSVHSLSSYGAPSSPEPFIRKCHTVIALSSTAGVGQGVPQATHTRLLKDGKPSGKMSFFKRMSSSKSAIFSSNRGAATINKSPSAVSDLRRLRKNSSLMFGGGDAGVGESTAGCSRCASTASLASARFSSGLAMDSVFCKLCLTDVSVKEIYQLQCLCRFCKYCMTMYTTLKIREGDYTIECPDSNCDCNGELTLDEVESLVGRELLELHLKFRVNREVDLDPLRTWCPTPSCETVVQLASSKLEGPQCATCSTCSTVFCASCSEPWHPGQSCHAAALMAEGAPLPNNDLIKRCPSCKVPIERDAGCAQMLCKKCKHVFCWYCLASLDDDFLLRHYDKGPCKNKLGHSRASVIWHRAQVIGIFAGFGLLLMVASPLLLFVGPCLLCCKCKPCAKAEVEEESLYGI